MATWPTCHKPANTLDGFDRRDPQRFACHPCHSGLHPRLQQCLLGLPLAAGGHRHHGLRWYLSYPLSARQVTELLGERRIDVSARTTARDRGPAIPSSAWSLQVHRRGLPHHQPYIRAAQQNLPGSLHIRTGLHRLTGETTKTDRAQPHRDPRSTSSLSGS